MLESLVWFSFIFYFFMNKRHYWRRKKNQPFLQLPLQHCSVGILVLVLLYKTYPLPSFIKLTPTFKEVNYVADFIFLFFCLKNQRFFWIEPLIRDMMDAKCCSFYYHFETQKIKSKTPHIIRRGNEIDSWEPLDYQWSMSKWTHEGNGLKEGQKDKDSTDFQNEFLCGPTPALSRNCRLFCLETLGPPWDWENRH